MYKDIKRSMQLLQNLTYVVEELEELKKAHEEKKQAGSINEVEQRELKLVTHILNELQR